MDTTKAQMGIQAIGGIAIAILIAAVVLGLGGTILSSIQTGQTDSSTTRASNQSLTWVANNTAIKLDHDRLVSGSEVVWNGTAKLTSGTHYDMTGLSQITFTNDSATDPALLTNTLNITYGYYYGGAAYNSSNYGMAGTTTLAEFIPTIAIVAIAGIIIGIILVFFRRKELM